MMDFSVVSGSVGLWKSLPHLLWTERTGIKDTLLDAFENTLAADGLRNTLSHAERNSSHVSGLLRHRGSSTVFVVPQHNSHSVLTMLFPLDGSNRGVALCQPPIQGSYSLALITQSKFISLPLSFSSSLLSGRALENSVQFTVALGFRICAKRKRTEEHPTL